MLKCRDIAQQSSDYIERRLGLRAHLAVALHLLLCGHCRAFIRQMRTAIALYGRLPGPSLTDQQARNIAAAAINPEARPPE